MTYNHPLAHEPQFPTSGPTDGQRFAPWLVLLSQHMPEACDDGDVSCSCGNPVYVGHLVRLIADRVDQPPASDRAVSDAARKASDLWEGGTGDYVAFRSAMARMRLLLPTQPGDGKPEALDHDSNGA